MESKVLKDGYTFEIKLPLVNFPALKPATGQDIGLEVILNDNDEITNEQRSKAALSWTGVTGVSGNPAKMGRIVFGKKPTPGNYRERQK
jgi:hypothetical protein